MNSGRLAVFMLRNADSGARWRISLKIEDEDIYRINCCFRILNEWILLKIVKVGAATELQFVMTGTLNTWNDWNKNLKRLDDEFRKSRMRGTKRVKNK